ncbi:hypothetical protein NEHOM01_0148 [Nematocida homosporus]|uniref:uncharacterized protein n=1 Tax=Nematocida homosporus TaxID=1912981 RepID=UPI002220F08B|nr:uncharacterized protein NEHOM01_0148 [Nematocida homosporus]KAI5184403.1 hypothetical protein NEHOM01_0148 [Nematocida homosporus]
MTKFSSIHYQRGSKLTHSSHSSLYYGRSCHNNTPVILKKLPLPQNNTNSTLPNELQYLQRLKHQHILPVLDIITVPGSIYLVTPQQPFTLAQLIPAISPSTACTYLLQTAIGLSYIHSQGIIHCDIKPSNLLISTTNEILISDFGISQDLSAPKPKLPGTLPYMAIELLLGGTNYDYAIDIWSLGIVFLEMLQHQLPFPGTGELDQIYQITSQLGLTSEDIQTLQQYPYGHLLKTTPGIPLNLPPSLQTILQTLLHYNPQKRSLAQAQVQAQHYLQTHHPNTTQDQ